MNFKLFDRWSFKNVNVPEESLKPFINLTPILTPKTGGRHSKKQFFKSKVNIVERLINKIMGVSGHEGKKHKFTSGRNSGKAFMVMQSVKKAFEIIEKKTNKNPIQMLVKAVINASPRAEITVIDTGGIKRPYAVDTASQRRVDLALRFLAHGSLLRSAKSPTPFYEALAEELISAANYDLKCYSIKKKENTERQALASR